MSQDTSGEPANEVEPVDTGEHHSIEFPTPEELMAQAQNTDDA
jgi:hypothetical protein